jgi:hypothetical protein
MPTILRLACITDIIPPMAAETEIDILAQLTTREPIFHRFEHLQGRLPTRAALEAMAAPGFFEIGASGRLYTRDFILDTLEERHRTSGSDPDLWNASDFRLRRLSSDTWLISYLLEQQLPSGLRLTRRSTLWQQTSCGWQILFHQGTLA